jgi:hypothetical protein
MDGSKKGEQNLLSNQDISIDHSYDTTASFMFDNHVIRLLLFFVIKTKFRSIFPNSEVVAESPHGVFWRDKVNVILNLNDDQQTIANQHQSQLHP